MTHAPLGPSGIQASRIVLGAWAIGGWMWGPQDEAQSIRAIHAAIDHGIDTIDTAPIYGFGLSEQVVGSAISGRRDKVILATKCGVRWDADAPGEVLYRSTKAAIDPNGDMQVRRNCSAASIVWEVEQSLKRLKTDRIDLLQTHTQDANTPIEETAAALAKLRQQGKIRAIGASNAKPEQLEIYRRAGALDTDQEKYSMLAREAEPSTLAYCHKHSIAFLAYSPLAFGLLTGKVGPERTFPPGDLRATRPLFSQPNRAAVAHMLNDFAPIARAHRATPGQIVLAWTLRQPGVTHALVGIRNEQQAQENAAAAAIQLNDAELKTINAALSRLKLIL